MGSTIQAREIFDADKRSVASLLARGLGYPDEYFLHVLDCLAKHATPEGFPKYGYLLESDGIVVGAIIMIFSAIRSRNASTNIRCHVTSWYVEPDFRCFATLFFLKGLKNKSVTYLNISARPRALPVLKVQGFLKYCIGQFVAFPVLRLSSSGCRVKVAEAISATQVANPFEQDLLLAHAKYGCISIWCMTSAGAYPFVFQKRYFKGFIPGVQLIYCRDIDDLVRFARPIGIFMALRGIFVVRIDSNGPISGLFGKFFDGKEPRYYKGPKPRPGDLTYTQAVICGYPRRRLSLVSHVRRASQLTGLAKVLSLQQLRRG
jgi:hypothetical protein